MSYEGCTKRRRFCLDFSAVDSQDWQSSDTEAAISMSGFGRPAPTLQKVGYDPVEGTIHVYFNETNTIIARSMTSPIHITTADGDGFRSGALLFSGAGQFTYAAIAEDKIAEPGFANVAGGVYRLPSGGFYPGVVGVNLT